RPHRTPLRPHAAARRRPPTTAPGRPRALGTPCPDGSSPAHVAYRCRRDDCWWGTTMAALTAVQRRRVPLIFAITLTSIMGNSLLAPAIPDILDAFGRSDGST